MGIREAERLGEFLRQDDKGTEETAACGLAEDSVHKVAAAPHGGDFNLNRHQ